MQSPQKGGVYGQMVIKSTADRRVIAKPTTTSAPPCLEDDALYAVVFGRFRVPMDIQRKMR